ncbi:MAG: hypothetical protein QM504_13895, partial [Pseudomonadota bacterium]
MQKISVQGVSGKVALKVRPGNLKKTNPVQTVAAKVNATTSYSIGFANNDRTAVQKNPVNSAIPTVDANSEDSMPVSHYIKKKNYNLNKKTNTYNATKKLANRKSYKPYTPAQTVTKRVSRQNSLPVASSTPPVQNNPVSAPIQTPNKVTNTSVTNTSV